jgi:guanylate kinase
MITLQRQGILICLLGPAGSGKTTLSKRLLEALQGTLVPSISVTTRPPRAGEIHGEHYFFVSVDDFKSRINKNEFFEWEEVHGNLYGTPRKTLQNGIAAGVDIILDIDIKGAKTFVSEFPDNAVSIFLLPPSIEELRNRIESRGCSNEEEIQKRISTSKDEFRMLLNTHSPDVEHHFSVDYCVLNEDIEEAFRTVLGIIEGERSKLSRLDKSFLIDLFGIG